MLVLSRRCGESIRIGDDIEIQVVLVRGAGDQAVVRLGINAPRDVTILREEVYRDVVEANRQSLGPGGALANPRRGAAALPAAAQPVVRPTPRPRRTRNPEPVA